MSREIARDRAPKVNLVLAVARATAAKCAPTIRRQAKERSSIVRSTTSRALEAAILSQLIHGSPQATDGSGRPSSTRAISRGRCFRAPSARLQSTGRAWSARSREIRHFRRDATPFKHRRKELRGRRVETRHQQFHGAQRAMALDPTRSPRLGGTSSKRPSFSAWTSSAMTGPGASHIRPSADARR